MPRQARRESGTGIFHVMMRGINHQNRRTQQAQSQTCLNYALQEGGRRGQWVNDPLDDDVQCLEIEKKVYSKPSDDQVWLLIKEQTGATSSASFQQLADEIKRSVLKQLKDSGASHRQLERLTGVG